MDYDGDYYDDEGGDNGGGGSPDVTPIQGPILLKNGTVPVVPLYSYPMLNNGSFVQIPVSGLVVYNRLLHKLLYKVLFAIVSDLRWYFLNIYVGFL